MLGQLVAVMLAADRPLPFAVGNECQAQFVLHCRDPRFALSVHSQTAVRVVDAVIETEPAAWVAVDFAADTPAGADRVDRLLLRKQMRLIAAERAVDIAASAHEVEGLANATHRHEHPAVVPGIGITVDHIIAI